MKTFTLEEIEDAWRKSGLHWEAMRDQLTRPKPEFAIGQLLAHQRNDFECLRVSANDGMKYLNYRPLTQQEVGPDWVPKEPVKALRKAVVRAIECICGEENKPYYKNLKETLAAFDEVIK